MALVKIYEKQIVNKAVEIINQNINVPISVEKITLNIFKSFPNVTLQLHNIKVESPKILNTKNLKNTSSYELLNLENLYLSFNIKALLNNSFELSEIVFSKGKIQLLIDATGQTNYDFVLANNSNKSKNNFSVLLKSVKFNDIQFNIENAYKKSFISLSTKKLSADGKFYKQKFTLGTKGKVQLTKYVSKQFSYIPQNTTSLELDMAINNDTVHIQNGQLNSQGINFNTKGYFITGSNPYVDLSVNGNKISIAMLFDLLPENELKINDFKSLGFLGISTRIKGKINKRVSPRIKANFVIDNGQINHLKTTLSIKNINLKGQYSNYSIPALSIPEFSFNTDSSFFKGSCTLSRIKNPDIILNSQFNINITDVVNFIDAKNIKTLSGIVKGNISAKGKIPGEITAESISKLVENSTVDVRMFNYASKNTPLTLNGYNGKLSLLRNQIEFSQINGKLNGVSTIASGTISNFIGIFTNSYTPVLIDGNFNFGNINYNNISFLFDNNSDSESTTYYVVNGHVKINQFVSDKLVLNNITGFLKYKNREVTVNNLSCKAFGGNINSYVELKPSKGNSLVLYTKTNSTNVDISKVFSVFDNFDQEFITHKNIKGKVSSSFDGEIFIIDGKPEMNTLDFLGHLDISNGELIDFEPMQKLSSFSSLDELMHLKFDKLSNDILISNGVINIPQMVVANNIMNLQVFGEQEMNGDYEYHIKILLAEIMRNKTRRVRQKQSEFGSIQDDGAGKTTIYLLATSNRGQTDIKFDKIELRRHLKKEMREEKKELKNVLNKEFGWFKKDTTLKKQEPKQKQFEIEWDGD